MSTIANTLFKQPLIGAPERKSDARAAAQGFAEIFGSMVAKGMRSAFVGDEGGLGGTGDGGSDIYSAMFDEAIGKSLANSPAMKPLWGCCSARRNTLARWSTWRNLLPRSLGL